MSLKTESQKQHWVTPSLLFPKAQAMFPTHIQGLLHTQLWEGCRLLAEPSSGHPCIWGFFSCILHGSFQPWVLFSCGTASMQDLHSALHREGTESDGVVKIWSSNWFGSWLPGLRSPCTSSGWLGVMSSCGAFRATPHLQKFLECLTEHNWAVCWLVAFP